MRIYKCVYRKSPGSLSSAHDKTGGKTKVLHFVFLFSVCILVQVIIIISYWSLSLKIYCGHLKR